MNIIVTGASQGIGFEIVKNLSQEGVHNIIAISRDESKLKKLEALCKNINTNTNVNIIPYDLSDINYYDRLLPFINSQFGKVDVLINNAGYLVNKQIDDITERDFDQVFNINMKAPLFLVKALLPYFSENAHIVNISSLGGFQNSAKFPGLSLYSSAKAALACLSQCMAVELNERKISVNCLAIGAVQTEMLEKAFPEYRADVQSEDMGRYIAQFALEGHKLYNGKILAVSLSTT
ncbi:MAG: SDR family oxidoreductase [Hyphomicrobiales bacterium]